MSVTACIGLGSNQGDRRALLAAALDSLRATPGIEHLEVSPYLQTTPVGGPTGQGPFLNAAATFQTTLEPLALLGRLQAIEAAAGRVRSIRWGERPLDLDLLLYGNQVIESESLVVPHPRLAVRRFVLEPLVEVAALAVDPTTGRTVQELLANLERTPWRVALCGWEPDTMSAIQRALPSGWEGKLFRPDTGSWPGKPTFLAAPESQKRNRSGIQKFWPVGTPIVFIAAPDPVPEIVAACLAAMPLSTEKPVESA